MNSAKRKQIRKQYITDTIAEVIGWSIVGALTYFTLKGFYWFTVIMFSFQLDNNPLGQ